MHANQTNDDKTLQQQSEAEQKASKHSIGFDLLARTTPREKLILGSMLIRKGANLPIAIYTNIVDRVYENLFLNLQLMNRIFEFYRTFYININHIPAKEMNMKLDIKNKFQHPQIAEDLQNLKIPAAYNITGTETMARKKQLILNAFKRYIKTKRARILPSLDVVQESLAELLASGVISKRKESK